MFQNLKVMSLEECTLFLSSKITIFFNVEVLMLLTIHILKILCCVYKAFIFTFNAIDFWSAGIYYDRLYFSKALKGNYVVKSCLMLL